MIVILEASSRLSVKDKAVMTVLPQNIRNTHYEAIVDIYGLYSHKWYGIKPDKKSHTKLSGSEFATKYERALDFIKNNPPEKIECPHITDFTKDGSIVGIEGNHRFKVFKKYGAKKIKLGIPKYVSPDKYDWIDSADIKLNENSEKNSLNSNFWKWFGRSVLRDSSGNPKVVFKGILVKDWESGDVINIINSTSGDYAGYFTDDKKVADSFRDAYATMSDSHVISVYLRLEKPYVLDAKGELAKEFMLDASILELPNNKELSEVLLQRDKYDSIIVKNTGDEGNLFIPFHSNQVKSVNNDGTWDLGDDNIYS